MMWSKGPASKSCEKKSSHHKLQNQKHKDHMLLKSNSTKPQKRKLDQYINDGEFATSYELTCRDKYGSENVKDQRRNPSPPLTCSTLSDGKGIILQGTQEYGFLAQNDLTKKIGIYTEDYSHLSDSNDSIKGSSYLMNQGSLNIHGRDLMVGNSHSCSAKISIEEKPKEEEDMDLIHSLKNFLPSRGNHLPRPFIPIGPRFQAEVPKWEGTTNIKQYNNDDCLKWLGTQIWPMPSLSETNAKSIGKDRLDSCSCVNLGSVDCVQKHFGEARENLKVKIDTTFSSLKFDDMGGDVSKSWTMDKQLEFESLVKSHPLLSDAKFWKLSMEYFPSKPLKCMINYYYSVYIPRLMRIETGSSFSAVDHEAKR